MQGISINLGSLSYDDILAGKTGNPSAELEILRIIDLLTKQEIFEVKIIELDGNSTQKLVKLKKDV